MTELPWNDTLWKQLLPFNTSSNESSDFYPILLCEKKKKESSRSCKLQRDLLSVAPFRSWQRFSKPNLLKPNLRWLWRLIFGLCRVGRWNPFSVSTFWPRHQSIPSCLPRWREAAPEHDATPSVLHCECKWMKQTRGSWWKWLKASETIYHLIIYRARLFSSPV